MAAQELAVRVRAPSRLHFGLLAIGDQTKRRFGGVGVMIERPATEVVVGRRRGDNGDPGQSDAALRAEQYRRRYRDSSGSLEQKMLVDALCVRVDSSAPEHVGLGSGTQLGMSVARAIASFVGESDCAPGELARRVGRGERSAVGLYGFQFGGFIVEGGKSAGDAISPLVSRVQFPADWHFLVVIPANRRGLHGSRERLAFAELEPMPVSLTAELCRLTMLGMLPALVDRDYSGFSESMTEFGRRVGECFASHQGGIYSSDLASAVIDLLARHGVRGVAQSSWGPTLAAVVDSRFRAEWLAARLADSIAPDRAEIFCTAANNTGARVEVIELG